MKRDVTRKLSNAGKEDCATEKILVSFFLLLFLTSGIFAQTQIDGFGRAREIKTFKNFTRLKALDFNEDGKDDYILYGIDKKKVAIHRSLKSGKISKPIDKFFFYPVTEISRLNKRKDFGAFYIALSKQKRLASLITFTKYGTLQLLNQHRFDSFPSELSVADLDGDGKNEALVFGGNFKGLSLLSENNFILKEKKLVASEPISQVVLTDFNYDGTTDIIYYDILNSELHFLKNNGNDSFNEERALPLISTPISIKSVDFNNDGFTDLTLAFKNKFEIMLGDSVSSFTKNISVPLPYAPIKFSPAAINKDNFTDFIFLFPQKNLVSALFNKSGKFLSPLKNLIDGKKIVDMFVGKADTIGNGIYFYDKNGEILKLLKSDALPDNFVFAGNGKPESVYLGKRNLLFRFTEKDTLTRDYYYWGRKPSPRFCLGKYTSDTNYVSSTTEYKNTVVTLRYSLGKSLISINLFNAKTGRTNFREQFLNKKILDVRFFTKSHSSVKEAAILFLDSLNSLTLKTFRFNGDSLFVTKDSTLFKITTTKKQTNVIPPYSIAWRNRKDSSTLLVEYLKTNEKNVRSFPQLKNGKINVAVSPKVKLNAFKNYGVQIEKGRIAFWNKKNKSRFFWIPKSLKTIVQNNLTAQNFFDGVTNRQIYFVYNPQNKTLYEFVYSLRKKKLKIRRAIESIKINHYFVTRFNKKKVFLVYLDASDGLVRFGKINED